MWKMSVQWSLAENDAAFRGSAGDDPLAGLPGDTGAQAGSAAGGAQDFSPFSGKQKPDNPLRKDQACL